MSFREKFWRKTILSPPVLIGLSENILNKLAYHFSQLLILKNYQDYKDAAYYQNNYSNFAKDRFIADFSKIRWNENENISTVGIVKLSNFHDKISDCARKLLKLVCSKRSLRATSWISVRTLDDQKEKVLKKISLSPLSGHGIHIQKMWKQCCNEKSGKIKMATLLNISQCIRPI